MSVRDYCQRSVETASPRDTLRDVARRMEQKGVGSVVLVDDDRRVWGIVTDRDIALQVLNESHDPDRTTVSAIVERNAQSVHDASPLAVASALMRRHGVRRLPVVDEKEHVIGIIAADDILRLAAKELSALGDAVAAQTPAARAAGTSGEAI